MLPGRAAGVLREIAKVMGDVRSGVLRAVSGRRFFAFKFQKWFLGAARKLRDTLAPIAAVGAERRWPLVEWALRG